MVAFNRIEEPNVCPCCRAPLTESGPALVVMRPHKGPTRFIGPFDNWQEALDFAAQSDDGSWAMIVVESLIPPEEAE